MKLKLKFWKKDKEESGLKPEDATVDEAKNSEKGGAGNNYLITIKEKLGSNTKTIKRFSAVRYLDSEDYVVYLYNKKLSFLELFPQQEKDFTNFDEKDIKSKLSKLKIKLKKELDKDTEDVNDHDLTFDIMKLEAKLRHIEYDNDNSSYITFEEDGTPEFIFAREGSTFHPFKWDADTKTIYTPSDNKKKSASMLLRNKEFKYTKFKDIIEGVTIFLLVISGVFAMGGGYMYYKAYNMYDTSNIAESARASLNTANACGAIVLETAIESKRLVAETKSIMEQFSGKINIQENIISTPPIREVIE